VDSVTYSSREWRNGTGSVKVTPNR